MNLKISKQFPLWVLLVAVIVFALLVMSTMGCKTTCEPTIIKVPVEVEIPVPVPPIPLNVTPPPEMEVCSDEEINRRVKCIRRNIERLRIYADALRDEIEAHNNAIPQ
jgi:hypothetical protein